MKTVTIKLDLPKTIDGKAIGPFRSGQVVELDDLTAEKFINSAMADEVLPPADLEDVEIVE